MLVGRKPHEPTFSRNGKEIWVTVRGENRIAILDTAAAIKEMRGAASRAVRLYVNCLNGPAQAWFSADGRLAYIIYQKASQLEVIRDQFRCRDGFSRPKRRALLDIKAQDPFGFTPFQKTTPDGKELWLSHKLADALSAWSVVPEPRLLDTIPLGKAARPNHIEFVENGKGKVVYASLARVDDGGPGDVASSQIAIIDRSGAAGQSQGCGYLLHPRARGARTVDQSRIYTALRRTRAGRTAEHAECRPDGVQRVRCEGSV